MTVHAFGSVILKMRKCVREYGANNVGLVVIDEQQTDRIFPRVHRQSRVLQDAVRLGLRVWFFITPAATLPGVKRRDEKGHIVEDVAAPTIQRLKNAAPGHTELQKEAENCFRVAEFADVAKNMDALVVMGKMLNSCVRATIINDDEELGQQADSAIERNIRVITSSKLLEKAGTDSYFPAWASNPLVDYYLYVGTRVPARG